MNNSKFSKAIYTLEFDKIREYAASLAPTEGAAKEMRELYPKDDYDAVLYLQKQTTDALRLTNAKGLPSFGRIKDITGYTDRAVKGAVLSTKELLEIANVFKTSRGLCDYIKTDRKFDTVLDEFFERILPNKFLEERITRSIISEDMISDEASTALSDIRRKIKQTNSKIRESLQKYITGNAYGKYLQDNIVTQRNGRYVIPVKSEYKNEIKGLVHDTSSSGATYFIEPSAVVDANNELKILQNKETDEIEKILYSLSSEVAAYAEVLNLNYLNITYLAAVFTRAKLSVEYRGTSPVLNKEKRVKLMRSRHPLLDDDKVVPLDIIVGENYSTLVITGPNTGGKTVTLKTLGLLSLMAQSGLHIPCADGSELCVFEDILADIGDEQSIEQSLSTFSAHMTNIVNIMQRVNENSLVLFDELGAGTDPVEGAALAVAVLDEVREKGAICAATTHYAELKAYAVEKEGVCNASCEFDVETLKPTYRLIIGTPGRSNAFAIAEKLGLPGNILLRAKASVNSENKSFENVISNLEAERAEAEKEKQEFLKLKDEHEKENEKIRQELEERLAVAEKELEDAKAKAREMLASARASSEFVFTQLSELQRQKEKENSAQRIKDAKNAVRESLDKSEDKVEVDIYDDDEYELPRELKVGDAIFINKIKKQGSVKSLPDKNGNLTVEVGTLITKTNVKNVRLIENTKQKSQTTVKKAPRKSEFESFVPQNFKPEIDLRGQNGIDAWFVVDKFFDEASLTGFKTVTLIHGKGTGALKASIWDNLKKDKRVSSFRQGIWGEGDAGVTVVELK